MKAKLLIASIAIAMLSHAAIGQQTAPRCKALTKKGTQCTRAATEGDYCKQHNPAAIRCAGKTKTGEPCKLLPQEGSKYCWRHQQQGR